MMWARTKVEDLNFPPGGDEHVGRLDVAMHDARAVHLLQRLEDGLHHLAGHRKQALLRILLQLPDWSHRGSSYIHQGRTGVT
eukprot:475635-Pyramimonas_sp.AAC.1